MPVTRTREKAVETTKIAESAGASKNGEKSEGKYLKNLTQVSCIRYPINFEKKLLSSLLDSSSKFNAVHLAFAKELGLSIRPTDVGAQKIDGTMLDIYRMVIAAFLIEDKANWVRFFEETFLIANISPEVVLGMFFLILSGANIDFLERELCWRTYTTKKAFSTTRRVELVGKKEFTAVALNLEYEIYVIYVESVSSNALPSSSLFDVYPFWRPQISDLIAEEAPTKVLAKYSDFADGFSPDLASELSKHIRINNHVIELVNGQ